MKKYIAIFILVLFSNSFAQPSNNLKTFASLKLRAITPIGIFSENWETGGGAYIAYGWIYSSEWSVYVQAGFNKYRIKGDSDYSNLPKLTMIPLQVGGRYYLLDGAIKPFFAAMTGINFLRYSYKLELNEVDEKKIHLNWQTGLGVAVSISNNLQIELSGMYNSHLINPSIPYNLTGYEFGIGFNWIF